MPAELPRLGRRTLIPTSHWLLFVVVFQAVGWMAVAGPHREWVGSWKMAYDGVAGSLVLVGPVAAGLAAVTYARIRRSSAFDLIRSGVSSVGWAFPLLTVWLALLTSTALLAASVTAYVVARGVPIAPAQLMNVPFLLTASLAHVCLGAVLGLYLREVWAGVAGVAASFLAFLLAATGPFPPIFMTGGTTGSMAGEVYRPAAMALLCLSAAGLGLALLAVLHGRFGGRRAPLTAVAALGLGVLLVGFTPHLDLEGRLRFAEVDYVCRGEGPQLCMARDTPLLAEEGAAALHRLSKPLVEAGVRLPDRWVQYLYLNGSREAGEFLVGNSAESTGRLDTRDVVLSLANPASCPQGWNEPARATTARSRLAGWIAVRNGLRSLDDEGDEGPGFSRRFDAWARSSESEPWVRSTYRQLRECRLRAIEPPPR